MAKAEENVALQVVGREEPPVLVNRYKLIANRLIAMLHELTAAIPDLVYPGNESRKFVRRKVGVPQRFVRQTVAALINSPDLKMVRDLDGDVSIEIAHYVEAFDALRSHLRAACIGVDFTLKLKEAELIGRTQRIYGFAKALARDSPNLSLNEVVQNLSRARRRPRRKSRRTKKATKG